MKIIASEKFRLDSYEVATCDAMTDLCQDLLAIAKDSELRLAVSYVLDALEHLDKFFDGMDIE